MPIFASSLPHTVRDRLALAMVMACVLAVAGCGPSPEEMMENDPHPYRCGACKHTFFITPKEIKAQIKAKTVVAPPSDYLRVQCPSCKEIDASFDFTTPLNNTPNPAPSEESS